MVGSRHRRQPEQPRKGLASPSLQRGFPVAWPEALVDRGLPSLLEASLLGASHPEASHPEALHLGASHREALLLEACLAWGRQGLLQSPAPWPSPQSALRPAHWELGNLEAWHPSVPSAHQASRHNMDLVVEVGLVPLLGLTLRAVAIGQSPCSRATQGLIVK